MISKDPLQRVLYIDLSRRRFNIENRPELFEKYIGGSGVAAALLHEECPTGADPLGPDNPVIFAVGPLVGLFPMASKTVTMFKSPHTGNLGESHAGGRSAVSIRMAGYGAIVIRGASDIPVSLSITNNNVRFHDARALWGMDTSAAGRVARKGGGTPGTRSIMRIGPAGENLVTYSCVVTETYRHFGRLGLGAVFGSKKLKSIAVSGSRTLPVTDRKFYKSAYDSVLARLLNTPSLKKYHDLGTAVNVLPLSSKKALPTCNLQRTSFEYADRISGENLAMNFLGRRLACAHCPISCIHLAALRTPYEDESYFYKTTFISYDYELIYSLGSMLGIGDPGGMLKLLDVVETVGVDAMSAGVTLAWCTEAFERGLISEKETMGIRPAWGDWQACEKLLRRIVTQPNDFYRALARGAEHAASVYGGDDFALTFGKNEMPGYHTGYGSHLNFLTGARHSHLDSAGYSYDQKSDVPDMDPDTLAEKLFEEESYRQILSSIVICFFARSVYDYSTITSLLNVAGFDFSEQDLRDLGRRILRHKYDFKFREGFSLDDVRIPKRILKTVSPHGYLKKEILKKGVAAYRKLLLDVTP